LTKTNSGTVTILATNTYTGPTVIGGGTISVSYLPNGGVASPIGASSGNSTNLLFTGGTLAYTGPSAGTARGAMLLGSGGTFDIIAGTTLTNTGIIGGSGTLTLKDSGTLWLNAANTNTGNIVINGGVLSDAVVENANYPVLGGLGNPMIAGRTVTINNGGILSLDATGGNEFGGGGVTNLLGYVINAGGLMRITSGNVTIGPVTLNGGTMDVYAGASTTNQWGAFEFTGDITVGGTTPSTIQSEVPCFYNLTAGSLVPYRTFNVTSSVLNVTATLGDSGSTIRPAGLIKTGAGTMMLSSTNGYTGNTLVSNGVLLVNGSIISGTNNGSVIVIGGTLGGSGIIGGSVTNQVGGTLAPGAGTNVSGTILTLNSNLTLQTGSITIMKASHSTGADQITSAGIITYGGLLLINTNGDSTPYTAGDTIQLFNLGSGGTYNTGSSFATIQPPPGPGLEWNTSQLTTSGTLTVVAGTPAAVVANLAASPTSGPAALAVTFTNLSSGATYWVWNFGDGGTLADTTGGNVTHTYNNANFSGYAVSQTAYGPGGSNTVTDVGYIVVTNATPAASFVGVPTNGSTTLTVTFTNLSSGGAATNYLWSFGDGVVSNTTSAGNVSHSYTNSGTYGVGLTTTGTGGASTLTNAAYIVATNPVPAVVFTGGPTNGAAPMTVTFTNLATFQTNSIWFYGNGVSNTLATASPSNSVPPGASVTQTYTNAGSYTVVLVVMGTGGTNTLTKTAYIVVTNPPPTAAFAGGPTNGPAPLTVIFTNNSTYESNSIWSFGDGSLNVTNATGTNVTHTYTSAGTNTVILTVTGTGGAKSLTNTAYIVVTTGSLAPVAGFSGTPTNLFVTQTVTFADASTGSITNWVWSFGDGQGVTNTTSASVPHAYAAAGSYTVSLVVNGAGGSGTNTLANYVVVKAKTALGGVTLSGGKLVFSGTNGPAGAPYRIMTATNVALPLASWTPVWTNVFAADGSYSYTNTLGTSASSFFLLVSP
jgi:autotransporter-associated beta strand protein